MAVPDGCEVGGNVRGQDQLAERQSPFGAKINPKGKIRMPDGIARANIEHFKKLLETETDAAESCVATIRPICSSRRCRPVLNWIETS
jgi:hypothetical protein